MTADEFANGNDSVPDPQTHDTQDQGLELVAHQAQQHAMFCEHHPDFVGTNARELASSSAVSAGNQGVNPSFCESNPPSAAASSVMEEHAHIPHGPAHLPVGATSGLGSSPPVAQGCEKSETAPDCTGQYASSVGLVAVVHEHVHVAHEHHAHDHPHHEHLPHEHIAHEHFHADHLASYDHVHVHDQEGYEHMHEACYPGTGDPPAGAPVSHMPHSHCHTHFCQQEVEGENHDEHFHDNDHLCSHDAAHHNHDDILKPHDHTEHVRVAAENETHDVVVDSASVCAARAGKQAPACTIDEAEADAMDEAGCNGHTANLPRHSAGPTCLYQGTIAAIELRTAETETGAMEMPRHSAEVCCLPQIQATEESARVKQPSQTPIALLSSKGIDVTVGDDESRAAARSVVIRKRGQAISAGRRAAFHAKKLRETARLALTANMSGLPSVSASVAPFSAGLSPGDPSVQGLTAIPASHAVRTSMITLNEASATMRANVSQTKKRRANRVKWRPGEIAALTRGVAKHGAGHWAVILREFAGDFDPTRYVASIHPCHMSVFECTRISLRVWTLLHRWLIPPLLL